MNLNHKLEVIKKKEIAPNIFLLGVKSDVGSGFMGGQYFSFRIADRINRSYSIASSPNEEIIEFIVDICPQGPGSKFVENLNIGDSFDAMGPFGFFTLEKTKALELENPLLFVATGTGIAPIRSMILDLLQNKKSTQETYLYFGMRYVNEAYLFDEFEKLSEKHNNFKFIPVISRPDDNWKGEVGYCQNSIMELPLIEDAKVYICGSNKNVESISTSLISYGYRKENVFFEKFG